MANFLSELKSKAASGGNTNLKKVTTVSRSGLEALLATPELLEDEHKHWEAFFKSGCGNWFELVKDLTFSSTFCPLLPSEAKVIVHHWEELKSLRVRLQVDEAPAERVEQEVADHFAAALANLSALRTRLQDAIDKETMTSSVGKTFVKLSTRSPKDSKKALAKAKLAYQARIVDLISKTPDDSSARSISDNDKWRILCEETTNSNAVSTADEALELLLDSDRVYEDLEYALRGPSAVSTTSSGGSDSSADIKSSTSCIEADSEASEIEKLQWSMELVSRSWDPRLKPESEFRGIVWGGKLTCLCQYFHPLMFEELLSNKERIQADVLDVFNREDVTAAVAALGGNCIVDFAWLGPGSPVIIIELNPFDGVCLGVFPASTGLFLWEDPIDQEIMRGNAPFEFRIRMEHLPKEKLKNQCNKDWRDIIYDNEYYKSAI